MIFLYIFSCLCNSILHSLLQTRSSNKSAQVAYVSYSTPTHHVESSYLLNKPQEKQQDKVEERRECSPVGWVKAPDAFVELPLCLQPSTLHLNDLMSAALCSVLLVSKM